MEMHPTVRMLAAVLALGPTLAAQGRLLDFPNQLRLETAQGKFVAGDVDGDGDLDLVVAPSLFQSHVLLLANDGSGGLRSVEGAFPPAPLAAWYEGVLFDVEGDGDLDVAFALGGGNQLYLQGPGTTFADASALLGPAATDSRSVAVLDRDLDGDLELYFGNVGQDQLLDNQGGVAFVDVSLTALPSDPAPTADVEPADVDGDGDADLLLGGGMPSGGGAASPNRLALLAAGAFAYAPFPQPAGPIIGSRLRATDVDGDLDLDVLGSFETGLEWYANDGAGQFATGLALPGSDGSLYLDFAVGDVHGDGAADVVASSLLLFSYTPRTLILRGDGTGGFLVQQVLEDEYLASPLLADVDGDLDDDLLHLNAGVLLNDGASRFFDSRTMALDLGTAHRFAVGDVEGDGDVDVVSAYSFGDGSRLFLADGGFHDPVPSQALPPAEDAALGDVDGDGDLDVFLAPPALLLWGPHGYADASGLLPDAGGAALERLALADLDGDGDLDAVLVGAQSTFATEVLYLGDGSGGFADASTQLPPITGTSHEEVEVGDLDRDGDLDVLLVGKSILLVNTGAAVFLDATDQLPATSGAEDAILFDADRDGDLDIASTWPALLENDGAGTFTDVTAAALPPVAVGDLEGVAAGDFDGDGDEDLYYSETIDPGSLLGGQSRLYLGDGAGTFRDATGLLPQANLFGGRAVAADLDRDGDLDLVVGGQGATPGIRVNLTLHLQRRGIARLGKLLVLDVNGPPGERYVVAAANAPIALELHGFGVLGLDPATVFLTVSGFLDAEGAATVSLPVPATLALLGFETRWQALVGAPPRLTNAERTVLTGF